MKAVYGFLSCIVFMGLRAGGENNVNVFLQDIITTFKLTSPTIVYNKDEETPDICHSAKWVLCLHSGMSSWYPEPEDDAKKLIEDSTGDFKHTKPPPSTSNYYSGSVFSTSSTGCPKVTLNSHGLDS